MNTHTPETDAFLHRQHNEDEMETTIEFLKEMERERNHFKAEWTEALLALGSIQANIAESFDLESTPITPEEVRAVCDMHAGDGVHTCGAHCQRPACVARRERDQARTAARKLRDAFAMGERLPWEDES